MKTFAQIAAAMIVSGVACQPATANTPQPMLPAEPVLDVSKYPTCQKDWISTTGADRNGKVQLINTCISQLESFNQVYLRHFTSSVSQYSRRLTALDAQYHHSGATAQEMLAFSQVVQAQLDKFTSKDSMGDFGDGYQQYYAYLDKYKGDVKYLTDSYNNINT
jgi:hypothetical protein